MTVELKVVLVNEDVDSALRDRARVTSSPKGAVRGHSPSLGHCRQAFLLHDIALLVLLVAMSMYCSVEGTKGRKEVFGWAVGFALASSEGEFSLQHLTYL